MPKTTHWSQDEIDRFPTGRIIEVLAAVGIPITEDSFLKDVAECLGAGNIYERWKSRFTITAVGFDEDFPWMAAEVLWRRLAPHKVGTGQLDDMMQEGYELIEERNVTKGCVLWLEVWEGLKPRFTKDMRTVEAADSLFSGSQFLSNWCQDVEMELGNAALGDPAFHDRRIRYCSEFCDLFPESHEIMPNMRRAIAESLFLSGRTEDADRKFQEIVESYPASPWGYIGWGDMYAGHHGNAANDRRAEELYGKALGIDPQEDSLVRDRMKQLRHA